jgi:hypothetical protein
MSREPNLDELAAAIGSAFVEPPPEKAPRKQKAMPWHPNLGPIGMEVLRNRKSETKFLYGERGSLKTGISLHDLILHCYQDFNPGMLSPLAVICTIVSAAATEGGAWEKLFQLYLPEWRDGIGLDFTDPKQDDKKNRYCFIGNKIGGWSRVVLKSIPHGESIRGRIKGIEPSHFFFDELPETDDPDYYLVPSQQLRRPTGGPRQFNCAGNPSDLGTEHWTWQVLVQGPSEQNGHDEPEIPQGGGRLIGPPDEIAVYHIPLSENVYWSADEKSAYQRKLMQEARLDPTAEDRLVKGIWTPRPSGKGLLKEYYIPSIHVKGDAKKGIGLLPVAGFPIILGYDLGQVYSSVTIEQLVPTRERTLWLIFDEVDHLGEKILYKTLAHEVIERMKFWCRMALPTNQGRPYTFQFMHVTDESAINQWRPNKGGSYDAWEFEEEYNKIAKSMGWRKMKMIGCPKGEGSVAARVRLLQGQLYQEDVLISDLCSNTKSMLMHLEEHKDNPEVPARSKWLHKFDSVTYPRFLLGMGGAAKNHLQTGKTAPNLIRCGSN